MMHLPDPEGGVRSDPLGDTIEIELDPDDILPPVTPADPSGDRDSPSRSTSSACTGNSGTELLTATRWTSARLGGTVGAVAAVVAFASFAEHTNQSPAVLPPAVKPSNLTPPVSQPVVYAGEPVRFKNPFDRSEIFEFPAGTSEEQARQAVAELLLQRADERRQTLHVGRGRSDSRPTT